MLNKTIPVPAKFLIAFLFLAISFPAFSKENSKEKNPVNAGSVQKEQKDKEVPGTPEKIADTKDVLAPVDPDSPTSVIKRYEIEVKNTVSKYKGLSDKESVKKKNDEILAKVRQFFDIYELGRLSLGDHWNKIQKTEQDEYAEVFRRLIERSYISKSDKLIGDYEVKYFGEKINNGDAEVRSAVVKEDADVDILYRMHRKNDSWMIYNIVADNTDLVKNYLSQFNSIIGKEGFPGLMKRMKNKLSDGQEE